MWQLVAKLCKKAANTAIIAFSGYEVGTKILPDTSEVTKTKIIIEKDDLKENNFSTNHLIIVFIVMITLAFVIVLAKESLKCIRKGCNQQVNIEAAQAQPQAARRIN